MIFVELNSREASNYRCNLIFQEQIDLDVKQLGILFNSTARVNLSSHVKSGCNRSVISLDGPSSFLYKNGPNRFHEAVYDVAMQLAGDLGGWGINLIDENGIDLSDEEHIYSQ